MQQQKYCDYGTRFLAIFLSPIRALLFLSSDNKTLKEVAQNSV